MDIDEEPGIEQIQIDLTQIEGDTVKQHVSLVDLQQKRKNLEIETEKKNVELQNLYQSSLDLEAEMQYHQMRLLEMEKRQELSEVKVQETCSEIEVIRSQIHAEKSKMENELQLFEKRKTEIMTTLLNAPTLFDQEHMARNVTTLKEHKEKLLQDIYEIDHSRQDLSQQFQATSAQWGSNLNNLDEVCKTMQKSITSDEQETARLKQKIEVLTKIVKKLKEQKAVKI